MKKMSLAFASILAVSTAAFAQTPPPAGPGGPDGREMKSITRAEALAKAGAHFDKIDTNKDGVIDAAERKAAHENRRGPGGPGGKGGPGGPGGPGPAGQAPAATK